MTRSTSKPTAATWIRAWASPTGIPGGSLAGSFALAGARARVTVRSVEEQASGLLASAFVAEDPVTHMWTQFADLGEFERHVIDNSRLDADETAALVWSRYRHGIDRL